jgi:hypothetical protein
MNDVEFRARGGELHGHVFENPRAGMGRGIYWSVRADFAPVQLDGSEWEPALLVDWMTFPVRRWQDLNVTANDLVDPAMTEASLYFTDIHQPVVLQDFRLRATGGDAFEASFTVSAELTTLHGETMPAMTIAWRGVLRFVGVYIVPENLFPKPQTADDATAVLAPFIDPSGFDPPSRDEVRFLFAPAPMTSDERRS